MNYLQATIGQLKLSLVDAPRHEPYLNWAHQIHRFHYQRWNPTAQTAGHRKNPFPTEYNKKNYSLSGTYLKHPLQVLEVMRIDCLDVMICNLDAKNVLVERSSEMDIQKLPIQ